MTKKGYILFRSLL